LSLAMGLPRRALEGGVGGGDNGSGGGEDRSNVTCSANSNGIVLKSESETDTTRDRIEIDIEVSSSGGSAKNLLARLQAFSSVSGTQAEIDFRVKFSQLIEYLEVDGVAGYSSNDTQGAVLNLGDESYTYSILADQALGSSVVKVVRASSTHFTITGKMGSALFNDSGVFAITNSIKIDVDISNFGYTLGSQARLALVLGVVSDKTQAKTQSHDDGQPHVDSEKINVHGDSAQGPVDAFFSWATTVDVTAPAATAPVIASPLTVVANDQDDGDNQDHHQIIFSFDALAPTTIHWDPLIGLGAISGATSLSISLCCLIALVWSGLAL